MAEGDGIRTNGVAECDPERHENHPGSEVHAAEECPSQEDHSDRCEDKLKIDHCRFWEVGCYVGFWENRLGSVSSPVHWYDPAQS